MGKFSELWSIANEINMIVLAITFIGVFFAIYSFTNSNIKNSHLSAWNIYVKVFENISFIMISNPTIEIRDISNKLYLQIEALKEFFNDNTIEIDMLNALHIIGRVKADHHNRNMLIETINTSIAKVHDSYRGRLCNNAINISNLIIFPNQEGSFENFINNWEQEIQRINNIIEDPIDLNIITTYVNCIRIGIDALTNNNRLLSFQDIENALLKIKIILPNDEFTNLFNYLHKINNGSTQFSTLWALFFNHHTALFNIVEIIRNNLNETIKDKSIFHKVN